MIRQILFIAIGLALAPGAQAAKMYKCVNAQGQIEYRQTYDPRTCNQGGAQLNDQGLAVKKIDRPKTAEEIAAEKAAAAAKAEEQRKVEERQREEQVLLMSYSSEDDLKRGHDQQLGAIDTAIATANLQLVNQQKSLADLLSSAAESERANQPVPQALADNITKVRQQIEEQNTFIARKEAEKADAEAEFARKLAHYREVVERNSAKK
ncbi:MAG TPA: DUF4124 domain-containing protein [Xanthomonadales bacterium]|nr:DUF4124 domain-containing protein [Xanthomonadales bacterium]